VLLDFNLSISYLPGEENVVADFFSRWLRSGLFGEGAGGPSGAASAGGGRTPLAVAG
jgi:hypothetical protein